MLKLCSPNIEITLNEIKIIMIIQCYNELLMFNILYIYIYIYTYLFVYMVHIYI